MLYAPNVAIRHFVRRQLCLVSLNRFYHSVCCASTRRIEFINLILHHSIQWSAICIAIVLCYNNISFVYRIENFGSKWIELLPKYYCILVFDILWFRNVFYYNNRSFVNLKSGFPFTSWIWSFCKHWWMLCYV